MLSQMKHGWHYNFLEKEEEFIKARDQLIEWWDWDDEFPIDLKKMPQEWFSQLREVSGVQVLRCYCIAEKNVDATSVQTLLSALV